MADDNFLDDIDDDDIDMTIFDEEEDLPKQEEVSEEEEIIQKGDIVVNTGTGEIYEEGPEAGLPAEVPPEDAKYDDDADDVVAHMDELGLTAPEKPEDAAPEAQAEEKPDETSETEKPKEQPATPAPGPASDGPKGNAIQKAISLMEYKHVLAMDPLFAKFEDCDFGEFTEEINEAQQIIDMYYTDGWEAHMGRAEFDLGKLSAIMARIGRAAGYLTGSGERFEDVERAVRAGCYTELKEIRDEHGVRVSDKDADEVSRALSAKFVAKYAKAPVVGRMVLNFWFAARKFIDVLEGIIMRNRSETKVEHHAEGAARLPDPDSKPFRTMEEIEEQSIEPVEVDRGCDF